MVYNQVWFFFFFGQQIFILAACFAINPIYIILNFVSLNIKKVNLISVRTKCILYFCCVKIRKFLGHLRC